MCRKKPRHCPADGFVVVNNGNMRSQSPLASRCTQLQYYRQQTKLSRGLGVTYRCAQFFRVRVRKTPACLNFSSAVA